MHGIQRFPSTRYIRHQRTVTSCTG